MELGDYPFMGSSGAFETNNIEVILKKVLIFNSMIQERVDTSYGKVKVTIYGDRKNEAIVTFHDLGFDGKFFAVKK